MVRRFRWLLLWLLSASVPAQTPPTPTIFGVVRDRNAVLTAVADAEVICQPLPWPDYPALRGLRDLPPSSTARSNSLGGFRVPGIDGTASLFVRNAKGLGAFVTDAVPGTPVRVDLLPMAEVTVGETQPDFELHAALLGESGERSPLPVFRGPAARLPAGTYEAWCKTAAGWQWLRLTLQSGQSTVLPAPADARRLARAGRVRVTPAGWPSVLLLDKDVNTCTLLGEALRTSLATFRLDDGRYDEHEVPPLPREVMPSAAAPTPFPPANAEPPAIRSFKVRAAGGPAIDAEGFLLLPTARGSFRVCAQSRAGADGVLRLPELTDRALELLVLAPGAAPAVFAWVDLREGAELALLAGALLPVECVGPDGVPAGHVVCEYVPPEGELAVQRALTDDKGHTQFAHCNPGGSLRISDARFRNFERAVDTLAAGAVRIKLAAGLELRGRAALADGTPAVRAAVTLRDPTGRLRPAERTVATDADGNFSFGGLPEDQEFVLFASAERGARTFSHKSARVTSGGTPLAITLVCEDPRFEPGAGR